MIDCPRCGKSNPADRAKCEECGTPLPVETSIVRAASPDLGRVSREPALSSTGLGPFTAFGSGDTLAPSSPESFAAHDPGGVAGEDAPAAEPSLLAEQLAAKNKEIKRLQFDLFRATERADLAQSRATAAGSGVVMGLLKGALVLVAVVAAFAGGLWYSKLDSPLGSDTAKGDATLKARIAEQQKKIEELQASLANRKSKPADAPPADAAPPAADAPTPASPPADAPGRGAPPPERSSATPPAERAAPQAAAKSAPAATAATGARDGTITWEGDWRDLIAMTQRRPLTIRVDGNQAVSEPEMQAATLDGGLPGVPVRIEALDPGVTIVEPPAEASGWTRFVIRLAPSPQPDRNSLHVKARLKWTRSDG